MEAFLCNGIAWLILAWLHPIHLSICEIEYDQSRQALEITHRIFIDDLELSLRNKYSLQTLDITLPNNGMTTDEMVRDYLKDNFQLAVNGKDFPYDYLGHEVEGDILYCYVEAIKVKKLKKIRVQNKILHELYDDQTNLVHVNNGNGIKSLKLDRGSDTDELVYD